MEHISEYKGVKYVHCDLLDSTGLVKYGFSTRIGGASQGVYESLNVGFDRGDKDEAVAENLRRISACFDLMPENMVRPLQTHTKNVRRVNLKDAGTGAITKPKYLDVDGLITNESGLLLYTLHADCTPIFLLDPEKRAIGMIHSGWKGTALSIGEVAVKSMKEEFGSKASDILAWIGPCICGDCYEVGEDVAIEYVRAFGGPHAMDVFTDEAKRDDLVKTDEVFTGKEPILKPLKNDKFLLDMKKANFRILMESGIKAQNISISELCTFEREDLFFSHRRMGTNRGTMGAFLSLI